MELAGARQHLGYLGIAAAILAAGTYESGELVTTKIADRKRLVGVNVCGKVELLHAVLMMNQSLGFPSADALTLIDIGSLHALNLSGSRALYSATKAFGLDFCMALCRNSEVRRAIYIAPGPIDTHILHRNHLISSGDGGKNSRGA